MTLSPEELAVVQALAAPIAFDQRAAFIACVTEAKAQTRAQGPGAIHRLAAAVQLGFIRTSVTVTGEADGQPRRCRGGSAFRPVPGIKDGSGVGEITYSTMNEPLSRSRVDELLDYATQYRVRNENTPGLDDIQRNSNPRPERTAVV